MNVRMSAQDLTLKLFALLLSVIAFLANSGLDPFVEARFVDWSSCAKLLVLIFVVLGTGG